jgi:long-chain acyl-CoA synthetase
VILDLAAGGSRSAIRDVDSSVDYIGLAARVAAARAGFVAEGLATADRVMLDCRQTVDTIVCALALLQHECAVLPMAAEALGAELAPVRERFAPHWLVRDGQIARGGADTAPPWDDRIVRPLQALLSGGSSGHPKIVLRSAAQVEAGVRIFATAATLTAADRLLLLAPLQHSFGFNSVMLAGLSVGAEVVLPGTTHPRAIVRVIEETGTTVVAAPPHYFDLMHRFAERRPSTLGDVRVCISVGDALPHTVHAAFVATFGVALWQSYGASEAGPVLLNRSGVAAADTLALGQPYPEVEVELCDEAGNAVPDGEVGEIVVRSPAVGLGYLGEHDGGTRIAGDRCFTGDLGARRGGEVHFAGRQKVLIVRAGRKIDPGEIERVLRRHPDVADAAVRSTSDGSLQALIVAVRAVPAADLVEHCARSLQPHKVPRIIEFRRSLPRDAAGKLKRSQLTGS